MTKHFSNPANSYPTDPKTYQVMISSADRQREKWLTIDRNSWENFTLGETVIYDGQTLLHEGPYPSSPIATEAA